MEKITQKIATFFSLFGSVSTLLCCALPVTLVSIGMGATFASLTASFPQIIWLTEKKDLLFILTAVFLLISYWLMKKSSKLSCPIDEKQREVCKDSKTISKPLFWFSVVVYGLGLVFSYILPVVMYES